MRATLLGARRAVRMPVRMAVVVAVLVAGLSVSLACSSLSPSSATSLPSADLIAGEEDDELAEVLRGGDSLESVQSSEFADFCTAVGFDHDGGPTGPLEVLAPDEVLERYRSALGVAPEPIVNELAALLEYLEFGTLPDFGTLPSPSITQPVGEADQELESEPIDEFVFIAPGPEQLALSIAEFIDQHCRSVTVSPLPPPTVPSAATPDYESDS